MNTKAKNHPIVICADEKGGVTKSTSCGAVADALEALGYSVRLVDADSSNRTLALMAPSAAKIDARNEEDLNNTIGSGPSCGHDITMIDMPGGAGTGLAAYFTSTGFDTFEAIGARIIVGITLTQTSDSVRGALAWIETFLGNAEFVIHANLRDTPPSQAFNLAGIEGGEEVLSIAENRIVLIPRWSQYMTNHYGRAKGLPSDYMVGGRVANKLKLNPLSAAPWQTHHTKIVRSAAAVAHWLTGKPIPNPPQAIDPVEDKEREAKLNQLRSLLK